MCTRSKPIPLPHCPQSIPRGKPWNRTRFLQATARPCYRLMTRKEQGRLAAAQLVKIFYRSREFIVVLTKINQQTLI
jgi:hypothetical protein